MPLRIGFDMDGVLADFGLAFHEVAERLYGEEAAPSAGEPEQEEEAQEAQEAAVGEEKGRPTNEKEEAPEPTPRQARRRRDRVWAEIEATPNFWETLKPTDPGAVKRIHEMMLRHQWEVFFVTQRPRTAGDTVQRQTQRWLVAQGFDLPSVLVLAGSRGLAAGALRLNYHVDDSPQNCIDVVSDSRAKPLLIVPDSDEKTVASARKLGIGTARNISDCLDILEQVTAAQAQPTLLERLAQLVGWREGARS